MPKHRESFPTTRHVQRWRGECLIPGVLRNIALLTSGSLSCRIVSRVALVTSSPTSQTLKMRGGLLYALLKKSLITMCKIHASPSDFFILKTSITCSSNVMHKPSSHACG